MRSDQAIPLAVAVVGLITALVQTEGKADAERDTIEVAATLARVVEATAEGLPCRD